LARIISALGLVLVSWLLWGSRSREEIVRAPIVRQVVKHPWLTLGALVIAAVMIVAIVVISGVVPLKASSGHWPVTTALLDFAKTRSVSTYSWGMTPPPLDDEVLVLRGAGHYETACLPCHGGPGRRRPPVVTAMTPPPPFLIDQVARWAPAELFTIVKHGIKFTGMPAWPAPQRDDEVWAMVAFLRRLPGLDEAGYARLVHGELPTATADKPPAPSAEPSMVEDRPQARAARDLCGRCHGIDGTGRGPDAFPSLAGQRAEYLDASLRAYRDGHRFSAVMSEIAARLGDADVQEFAAYYERLPPRPPETPGDDAAVARGKAIATAGLVDRDIPACVECHGPTSTPKNPAYPRLAAQHMGYLTSQLELLQGRRRGGTPHVNLMHAFVSRLRQHEIRDVARYYSTLPGPPADDSNVPPPSR
jgi:cytochrome c553